MAKKTKARAGGAPPRHDVWPLLLLALTLVAYLPALGNDFVNWDDDHYVYDNPKIRAGSLASLPSHFLESKDGRWVLPNVMGNYHPLTMVSLQVDGWLSASDGAVRAGRETDLHAAVFHVTNVALHLANTWLVFLLVSALVAARREAAGEAPPWLDGRRVALAVSALFGVATMHVESVAWVSERKDVLYTFFFLLALFFYVRYARKARRADYWTALGFFVASLLSKGQAVTLAVTLPLVDWLLRRPLRGRVLAEKAPFLALALVFGLVAIHTQREGGNVLVRDAVQPHYMRPFFAAYGLVSYVAKLLAPRGLLAHYPYALVTGQGAALYAFLPMALALLGATWWLARRSVLLAFGPLFFLVNIAPVLQLLPVGSAVMADRYSYLPSLGVFFLAALGLAAVRHATPRRTAVDVGFALYVLGIGGLTMVRSTHWRNSETLWTAELRRNAHSAIAHNNLATFKYRTGDVKGALASVERALALDPEWHKALTNRAVLRDLDGQADLARADYDRSLALRPDQPVALNNRGKLKQEAHDLEGARADFTAAIAGDPRPMFYANRAEVNAALGHRADAIADYTAALAREPGRHDWHAERAILRSQTGDPRGALDDFSAVVRLVPDSPYPYLNRARARAAAGECTGAREDLAAAAGRGVRLPDEARRELAKTCPDLAPSS
jgi:protein O-mannosyl-transferase